MNYIFSPNVGVRYIEHPISNNSFILWGPLSHDNPSSICRDVSACVLLKVVDQPTDYAIPITVFALVILELN